MFFGNERKKLEEKIKILEEKSKRDYVSCQVLSLYDSLDILCNENILDEEKIYEYYVTYLIRIFGNVAQRLYNLKGFKTTEDPIKRKKLEKWILYSWDFLYKKIKEKTNISKEEEETFYLLFDSIMMIPSPDPKLGYNVSEFEKE